MCEGMTELMITEHEMFEELEKRQPNLYTGLPLDVTFSSKGAADICELSEEQLNSEIAKGYRDILDGRVLPIKTAFAQIRKEFSSERCAQPVSN